MLRRDRRRAQAAVAAAVAQAVDAAATSTMAEAAAEAPQPVPTPAAATPVIDSEPTAPAITAEQDAPTTAAPAQAEPVAGPEPVAASEPETAPEPVAAATAHEEPAPASARGRKPRAQKARKTAAGPRRSTATAATPQTSRPARPARPTGRRRVWKMTGAALAIATLVGGTAVPAIGMVNGSGAVTTAASADLRTQSFTASAHVLPEVVVSGEFSATTPEELVELQAVAAATSRSGVPPIAKPGQIIVPMAAGTYSMTDGFGASRPGRTHMGQDYAAPIGTPIYASADGVVTMSQDSYGGYGVTVQIQHDEDGSVSTLYGHMNYGTRAVDVGDHVVAGQFLGRVGDTGYTIGSCLHFEVHINGAPINPVPWLQSHVR